MEGFLKCAKSWPTRKTAANRLKISVHQTHGFRERKFKRTHSSQPASHRSDLNTHQQQSETSCRPPSPPGAFVTTALLLSARTFNQLLKSRSDLHNCYHEKHYKYLFCNIRQKKITIILISNHLIIFLY